MNARSTTDRYSFLIPFLSTIPVFTVLFFRILTLTDGTFAYTLDDAYIHLAIAENIWHGTYGINLGEIAAPASSIIWPLMLAPFASFESIFEYVPLVYNLLFLVAISFVIDRTFCDLNFFQRLCINFFLLLSINVFGVAFTGMEHSLHLLAGAMALHHFLKPNSNIEDLRFLSLTGLGIILLPLIRYEGLAISLPLIAYIFLKGRRVLSIQLFVTMMVPMLAFSLFLYINDLGWLPWSVRAKSSHGSVEATYLNIIDNLQVYGYLLVPIFFAVSYYWERDKYWALALLATTGLYFAFGKNGIFGRYELFYVIYLVLIFTRILVNVKPGYSYVTALYPFVFTPLVLVTLRTPLGASNVFYQHFQAAEIVARLDEPVAVGDLGLMALRSDKYVQDIWGLASLEAMNARLFRRNEPYLGEIVDPKGIKYVVLYEEFYRKNIPDSWIKVGTIYLNQRKITPSFPEVFFYATDSASVPKLKEVMLEFKEENKMEEVKVTVF